MTEYTTTNMWTYFMAYTVAPAGRKGSLGIRLLRDRHSTANWSMMASIRYERSRLTSRSGAISKPRDMDTELPDCSHDAKVPFELQSYMLIINLTALKLHTDFHYLCRSTMNFTRHTTRNIHRMFYYKFLSFVFHYTICLQSPIPGETHDLRTQ